MEGHAGTESTHLHVTVWKDLQMEKEESARSVRSHTEFILRESAPPKKGVQLVQNSTTTDLLGRHISSI